MNFKIIHKIISDKGLFPNNNLYPLLIYKKCFNPRSENILQIFKNNEWKNSWTNGIYDFHHFHSITHEVLGILNGQCTAQFGGPHGEMFGLEPGDIVIIPAGVAHKNLTSTQDFQCVGAYPFGNSYDMNYGNEGERPEVDLNIKNAPFPSNDPLSGKDGAIFSFWKI